MNPTVTSQFFMQLESGIESEPVLVRARYSAERPFEMSMDFRLIDGSGATWTFARDLLVNGAACPGEGDLEVWRQQFGPDQRVFINLSSPGGDCLLSARAVDIDKWCHEMTELVPIGSEHEFFDIDRELKALLRRAWNPRRTNRRSG
ncbi:SsgA family sporulation/cell division regulator [Kitasatospora sp. NPDC002227]|uniref:SsgA family sporulation/cell division regulator n=1 Tax=Kitasatospora sp. NPDC002227 TaxID=3154773 RepID=UPI00332DFE38